MNEIKFPLISEKLIKCLKELYPNKLPTINISDFDLGRLIGQQDIISKLIIEQQYQSNNELPLE